MTKLDFCPECGKQGDSDESYMGRLCPDCLELHRDKYCRCLCHITAGVRHVVPCCSRPPYREPYGEDLFD